jgi:hypothetical protein
MQEGTDLVGLVALTIFYGNNILRIHERGNEKESYDKRDLHNAGAEYQTKIPVLFLLAP